MTTEALKFIRHVRDNLAPTWALSPEGRRELANFDAAIRALASLPERAPNPDSREIEAAHGIGGGELP